MARGPRRLVDQLVYCPCAKGDGAVILLVIHTYTHTRGFREGNSNSRRKSTAAWPGGWRKYRTGGDNRTICRSLSRTREVRRSANQIGIPPLVDCHKMAALNQTDSAYWWPPTPEFLHEALRKTPPIDSFLQLLFAPFLHRTHPYPAPLCSPPSP
ncbi:hypothetical protein KQX54_017699 [Cotesia glomerata]|uniref:Uncharacterized protein n=1 Tax=Cotesia glomerata TaxID=32391 RepID=A0AAV7ICZ3_COTGL|nr:hypothetical protein KQX54_017699 [Cotesia glomerata]